MSKKVILIMTDTQRWDMCGCYKNTGLSTPCIDKLAQNGMRFERAYTTQPVCQPARAGIFLGQYPHSCGSWANSMGISDNSYSIGKRLSDKGIHTAYIGKWHLDGGDYFGLGKCPEGWDSKYWYDMRLYLEELTEEERIESRTPETMRKRAVPAEFTFGRRCSNRAVDFLQNHGNEDF
ncbi:MAG: sulfatase-like hydrolase/transferase, partial [Oscillospiraceae bacterium]|nr:sulfatase-like hydrolase/transferase [Oscillospiraceae bacterium]